MRYYEDIPHYQDALMPIYYHLDASEIMEMGQRFDPMPFHLDRKEAEKSIYGGLVASSCHVYCIYLWLMDKNTRPAAAVAALGLDKVRFHNPARPDDRLHLKLTTALKRLSESRADCGIVQYQFEVIEPSRGRTSGEPLKIMSGTESVMYKRS